ncbi:hypothetical protein C1645_734239 [Glomus cerebriforme]|uniref:Uncharacterized protein n=1 Tax=Glomus cerebriforme TaxID=658196 RepID=A0A397TFN4_9GLOM|nr:hypothetical protein C1645_734239 [Glomus cerebriforme]
MQFFSFFCFFFAGLQTPPDFTFKDWISRILIFFFRSHDVDIQNFKGFWALVLVFFAAFSKILLDLQITYCKILKVFGVSIADSKKYQNIEYLNMLESSIFYNF